MAGFWWSAFSFIIVIAVLVFVHEYGHFWAARKCGVFVQRFSIGFGKVLWQKTDKHGTEFAISLIPLGGYVKMLDTRNEAVPEELKEYTFDHKSVGQRAFIIAAGPLANFLFAIFAYWVVFLYGLPIVKPVIGNVVPQSLVEQAGIKPDYLIEAVDGVNTPDWESINLQLATKIGNPSVTLKLRQFENDSSIIKTINLQHWNYNPEKESAFTSLGIEPKRAIAENKLQQVMAQSPAALAGLQAGDIILSVNGQVMDWQHLVRTIRQGKEQQITLVIERDGKQKTVTLQPKLNDNNQPYIGVVPVFKPLEQKYRATLKYDILPAFSLALEKVQQLSWTTVKVMGKLLTGDISVKNLSGPISIAQGAGISSRIGLVYYLSFMALISINLGIMNLFPLPILDGGHLVFLGVEAITKKAVSEHIQGIAYRIGAILLLTLTIVALFNDVARL
ncbi:RIP metalloprotease RseP [Mergibacter septicus]|uniref:Zinc metalloprotease n=1 Tax=Mergibacter septicus TaxID=221402 RepID=A0A8D4IY74_9PAST|nr:sigma E protease regulator RseP [Mergibacter septicus]AWX15841.1 RIP metalloprotease RseP [Mergibacter septicus]QDJ15094.1 RIP metalloprotease RseP [Mergibacter septicus]UTU47482.1 sigma E protease regulator RseP [Mergibacter septicus]WMR95337.1 sigma E protease regulator RseP [Mergibacter septicus]